MVQGMRIGANEALSLDLGPAIVVPPPQALSQRLVLGHAMAGLHGGTAIDVDGGDMQEAARSGVPGRPGAGCRWRRGWRGGRGSTVPSRPPWRRSGRRQTAPSTAGSSEAGIVEVAARQFHALCFQPGRVGRAGRTRARTRSPRPRRISTTWLPSKPVAPVTTCSRSAKARPPEGKGILWTGPEDV